MLTLNQLRAQVGNVRSRSPNSRGAIVIAARQRWTGPDRLDVGGERFGVRWAESELELRSALMEPLPDGARPLVLTPLDEGHLAEDLLCRFTRRRIHRISAKDILADLFKVRDVAPQLHSLDWMANLLAEARPTEGYPSPAQGVLDLGSAWQEFLRATLGIAEGRPDLVTLLLWARQPQSLERWRRLPPPAQAAVEAWVVHSAGPESEVLWATLRRGGSESVVSLGLVAALLYRRADVPTDVAVARGRFQERYVEGLHLELGTGAKFAEAAIAAARTLGDQAGAERLEADGILSLLGVGERAHELEFSSAGWKQRLRRFGTALGGWLSAPGEGARTAVETAAGRVLEHDLASVDLSSKEQVEMATRLVRWLASASTVAPIGFDAACGTYVRELSFVDWARYPLFHGHAEAELNRALDDLVARVGAAREQFNEQFGKLTLDWTAAGSSSASVDLIEQVLPTKVTPLLRSGARVLMIVLDGMSYAIYRQLAAALVRDHWAEALPPESSQPKPALAGVPSITEWSRRLLLGGTANVSPGADESMLFRTSPAFQGILRSNQAPLLFLKAGLTDDGGRSVSPAVRDAILTSMRPLVGVVINAIDDHLAKDDQLRVSWPLNQIPIFSQVLDFAREAGRTVVLTSDHGHVVSHRSRQITGAPNDRFRSPDGKPLHGECHFSTGRGALFSKPGVFVPWTELGFYTSRRNGLHGGVSPQEVLVPASVFVTSSTLPEGWTLVPQQYPTWWWGDAMRESTPPVRTQPTGKGKQKAQPPMEDTLPLFVAMAAQPVPVDDWVDRLFATRLYQEQYARVGRNPPPPETVRRVLIALRERQGTLLKSVLAQTCGIPEIRLPGLLAMLRRIFNVEGYPVLSVEDASGSVRLNLEYLKTQFEVSL